MAASTAEAMLSRGQEKVAKEKRASLIFTSILVLASLIFGLWVLTYAPISNQAIIADQEGKPRAISNLFMASTLCKRQAGINYRGSLISSITDDFSTRYDYPRDIFIVLLMVSVYDSAAPTKEYRVHCHVIPDDTVVDYFKTIMVNV